MTDSQANAGLARFLGHLLAIVGLIGSVAIGYAVYKEYGGIAGIATGFGVYVDVLIVAAVLLNLADISRAVTYLALREDDRVAKEDARERAATSAWLPQAQS